MIDVAVEIVTDPDDPRLAMPMVSLEVDGVPVRGVLDSGASRTRLAATPEVLERLASQGVPRVAGGLFGSDAEEYDTTAHLTFGGCDLGSMPVTTVAESDIATLVGQDVLSRFRCEYRLGEALLRLDGPMPPGGARVDIGRGGHVLVGAEWPDGVTGTFLFDTGASITVLDSGFIAEHPSVFQLDGTSTGTDADGVSQETPTGLMHGLSILGRAFGGSPAAVVDLSGLHEAGDPVSGILGWPIISAATWVIDHQAQRGVVLRPCAGAEVVH